MTRVLSSAHRVGTRTPPTIAAPPGGHPPGGSLDPLSAAGTQSAGWNAPITATRG
jgi:hypothetical protein